MNVIINNELKYFVKDMYVTNPMNTKIDEFAHTSSDFNNFKHRNNIEFLRFFIV